jgi:hypothetical protein
MMKVYSRRQLMMEMGRPYDAVVEYLQSDGNAYIDTGIKTKSDIRVEVSFSIASKPNTNFAIFGGRTGYANNENTLFYYGNKGAIKFGWRYGSEEKSTEGGAWTGDYVASNVSAARAMVISGATSATMTATSVTFSIEPTMFIFTMNNNGSTSAINYAVMIKRFKMYNGTTLVRDFIPVRKNSVGYFYDKINDTFYGNAGTGNFILGPDK